VYIPFRGCEMEVRHLRPMFDHGQVKRIRRIQYVTDTGSHIQCGYMPFSPKDDESIFAAVKHSDVVINLIGKFYETKHIVPTRRANGKVCNSC
jgi:NADH dehydrogenase (ubiquinone) 1 alpha subcomplex subunit 9